MLRIDDNETETDAVVCCPYGATARLRDAMARNAKRWAVIKGGAEDVQS
jgi:hypothetical protein